MGTALATLANKFLAVQEEESNPWIEAGAESGFFGTFLKFSGNDGKYSYGKKDEEEYLKDGHELIANLIGVKHGHICWVEGSAKDEINYLVLERPKLPSIDQLPDYGPYKKYQDGSEDGWQEQVVLELYSPELDMAFTAKLAGGGKLRAARQLIGQFGRKGAGKIGKDGLPMFPVIELGTNSFTIKDNPKAGTKYAPVFKIVDFEEMSAFADIFEAKDDDGDEDDAANYEQEAPRTRAAAQVEDKRRAAPAEEAPRGRGRAVAEEAEEAPRSRRGAAQQPKEEVEDAQFEEVKDDEAPAQSSRRARVVHAEPQDDDLPEAADPRQSARGRRGRAR